MGLSAPYLALPGYLSNRGPSGRGKGVPREEWVGRDDEFADGSPDLHWSSAVRGIEILGSQPNNLVAEVIFYKPPGQRELSPVRFEQVPSRQDPNTWRNWQS